MARMESSWVLDEDDALDLLAFLVTAARTQLDEAREYGPMRLLMAAHRLADAMAPRSSSETRSLIEQDMPRMPALAVPRGDGAEDYVARLDTLCAAVGAVLARRYAPEEAQP
jgi:Family of unknown function (DUF6092)